MSIKSKIADEEIRKYINEGKSNSQIAKALGTSQPNINARCNKLRKEYGELLPDPEESESIKEQKMDDQSDKPPADPPKEKSFPFEPKEKVLFSGQLHSVRSVGQSRMVLCRNADMKAVTIMLEDYNAGRASVRKIDDKPPIKTAGEESVLKKRREDEEAEAGDFEVAGKPIKDLPEPDKKKIVEHFKEELPPAPEGSILKPIDRVLKETKATESETKFESVDYTDEAWGSSAEVHKEEAPAEEIGMIELYTSEKTAKVTTREYLIQIDELLDLMIPNCPTNETGYKVRGLAMDLLNNGIKQEIEEAGR